MDMASFVFFNYYLTVLRGKEVGALMVYQTVGKLKRVINRL